VGQKTAPQNRTIFWNFVTAAYDDISISKCSAILSGVKPVFLILSQLIFFALP